MSTPFLRSSLTALLAASASSMKVSPATPVGVTIVGVASSTSPMNADLELLAAVTLELLDAVRREQRLAGGVATTLADRYWNRRPGYAIGRPCRRRMRVRRAGAADVGPAAAVLDPQQFGRALVELVVADRGEVDVHQVGHDRRRLLEEQPVTSGLAPMLSPAITVTSLLAVRRLLVLHRLGQPAAPPANCP